MLSNEKLSFGLNNVNGDQVPIHIVLNIKNIISHNINNGKINEKISAILKFFLLS